MPKCAIKICGICHPEDARLASEAGADYVGILVDVPNTPRSLTADRAIEVAAAASVPVVLLLWEPEFAQAAKLAKLADAHAIQLLADETMATIEGIRILSRVEVWKAVHLPARGTGAVDLASVLATVHTYEEAGVDAIVLDARATIGGKERRGGTGLASDWSVAAEIIRRVDAPVLLAGGINPDNVVEAIRSTRPFGIDLASGAESEPGRKDEAKVRTIVRRVRELEGS